MEKQLFDITKQEAANIKPSNCININVGVLGHVDSGKTSICRILSEIVSTASLDKNPQSQQRGITLDLGFSAFLTRVPHRFQQKIKQQFLQFTLVDCPGHASLIRTIIGGAQIIDLMFLVVDITKGIQAQTAECIIIAQLFIQNLIVVLNKTDMIEDPKVIQNKTQALRKVFSKTKFGQDLTMVPFSTKQKAFEHSIKLKEILLDRVQIPDRKFDQKFLFLIDHCFKIKGKGTVITGTVVSGKAKPGEQVQLCQLQKKFKIKSIQMFRKTLNVAKQGDRAAMLMIQLEAEQIQRGLACTPGYMKKIQRIVMDINKVRLYKRSIKNKTKFHIISGHQTVMGELRLFVSKHQQLDLNQQFVSINDFDELENLNSQQQEVAQKKEQIQKGKEQGKGNYLFAVVSLQKQMYACEGQKLIGYKFDVDNDEKMCRIAFHGKIQLILTQENKIKIYKQKQKRGIVDRIQNNYSIIVKDLFSKQFNLQQFIGKQIRIATSGQAGRIDGSFGKSGKIRVSFKESLQGASVEGEQVVFKYKKWY